MPTFPDWLKQFQDKLVKIRRHIRDHYYVCQLVPLNVRYTAMDKTYYRAYGVVAIQYETTKSLVDNYVHWVNSK